LGKGTEKSEVKVITYGPGITQGKKAYRVLTPEVSWNKKGKRVKPGRAERSNETVWLRA